MEKDGEKKVAEKEKEEKKEPEKKVVDTSNNKKNGQDKCPKCGSTEISTNIKTGKLRCEFCRHEFEAEKVSGIVEDISKLEGEIIGSGAQNIEADSEDVVTLKCTSCGAEVVIDTSSAMQARCHWCRNTLSINEKIPNGSVPDIVLAFSVTKEEAQKQIDTFVGKRKFFAHPKFRKEFTTENIMGVYFPYMLIDINAHSKLVGEGEHEKRSYTVKHGDDETTYYDADLYHVERDFDITIKGLSIESSSDRLNNNAKDKTNNIINSIMPFDIENCVKYNANYLKGYTSEKRDTNIDDLKPIVNLQAKDITRFAANKTLKTYDRGVAWQQEDLKIKGQQWQAAYLPVWLYSYQEITGNKKLLHYVAVNARTKETMGSVPIHMPKLIGASCVIETFGFVATLFVDWDYKWSFLLIGIIYFFIMYSRYRNAGARHTYELETKTDMTNLKKVDNFIKTRRGLTNAYMIGANNKRLEGNTNKTNTLDKLTKNNKSAEIINKKIEEQDQKDKNG